MSRRFGTEPKLLAAFDGEPLIRRVVRSALGADLSRVVVVLGHQHRAITAAFADLADPGRRLFRVLNPEYRDGQSTSVRRGLSAVAKEAAAAVFVPADQPFLSSRHINRMVDSWRRGAAILVSRDGERQGAPVLFDRRFFPELALLRGDCGGRALLPRHQGEVEAVEVEDPLELADMDTPEELEILRRPLQ